MHIYDDTGLGMVLPDQSSTATRWSHRLVLTSLLFSKIKNRSNHTLSSCPVALKAVAIFSKVNTKHLCLGSDRGAL